MSSKKKQKKKFNLFKYFMFDFVKLTGAVPMLLWLRPKYVYESKNAKRVVKGGALVVSNHISTLDPIIMNCFIWYRRVYTVAMKELFDTPLKNWFFRKILCIPIDRENTDVRSFKDIINVLKEKHVVGIFPEGHINFDNNEVKFFKSGVVLMALKGKAPIVPMVIIRRNKWYKRQVVVVGDKIELNGDNLNLNDIDNFSKMLRKKEEELIELYSSRRKKHD